MVSCRLVDLTQLGETGSLIHNYVLAHLECEVVDNFGGPTLPTENKSA